MEERPWITTKPPDRGPLDVSAELEAELNRVGVSMREAGFKDGVFATETGEYVQILGPPRERPRRWWRGTEAGVLELLSSLADGAGVAAFWATFEP